MAALSPDVVSSRAPARGLDVVALLCAVLVPPVGALLGLLSRRAAKDAGLAPHVASTIAIVVGTLVTGVAMLYVLAPALATVAFLR